MRFLVVGGSRGIGLSLVEKLLHEGHQVIAACRTAPAITHTALEHWPFDATSDTDMPLEGTALDGLAYLPGSIQLKPFHRLNLDDFMKDLEINVLGAVSVIQQSLPALKKSGGSSILLFSTVAVKQGMPYHASVATSKGALEGLARSLAAELAPHIRVNVIAPSLVDTPLAERLLSSSERRQASAEKHPLKRVGRPADIADLGAFLLGPQGSWISGQVMGVDGGISALKV